MVEVGTIKSRFARFCAAFCGTFKWNLSSADLMELTFLGSAHILLESHWYFKLKVYV